MSDEILQKAERLIKCVKQPDYQEFKSRFFSIYPELLYKNLEKILKDTILLHDSTPTKIQEHIKLFEEFLPQQSKENFDKIIRKIKDQQYVLQKRLWYNNQVFILKNDITNLKEQYQSIKNCNSWLALSVFSAAMTGLFIFLSEDIYQDYNSTSISGAAENLRFKVNLFDGIKIGFGIATGVAITIFIFTLKDLPENGKSISNKIKIKTTQIMQIQKELEDLK